MLEKRFLVKYLSHFDENIAKPPCVFSLELFLAAAHDWFAIQTNVWKVQNTTGRFLSQLHPFNFVLKILFLVPKVSNS